MLQSGLPAPVLLSPQASASLSLQSGVTLKWQQMSGAAQYLVKIDYPGAAQTERQYTDSTELTVTPRENQNVSAGQMSVSIAAVDRSRNIISPPRGSASPSIATQTIILISKARRGRQIHADGDGQGLGLRRGRREGNQDEEHHGT
jgi:hypothetical protein